MSWHDYPRYRLPEQQEFYDSCMATLWFVALVAGLAPAFIQFVTWVWWKLWPYWHWV